MRFAPSHEQLEFRKLVRELLTAECTAAVVRGYWAGEEGAVRRVWTMLAELGVTGLLVPDEQGGLGLDETTLVPVLAEAGYAALPGPLVETVAVAAPTLPALPLDGGIVDSVLSGSAWIAVDEDDDGLVAHAGEAAVLLCGGWSGRTPVRVAAVEQSTVEHVLAVDRTRRLARCRQDGAVPARLDAGQLARFWQRGVIGTSAMLTGLARRMLDMTVDYVAQRHQFGVPIGSFQAVKHKLADVKLAIELAEPAVLRGGYSIATADATATRHVSMAKVLAGQAATLAATTSIQCHGAMGYTEESDLHLFAKRALALAGAWGSTRWHRLAIADDLAVPAAG